MCHNAGRTTNANNPAKETNAMKTSTKNAIGIASALGRRGFTVASVEVHTPDGRTWAIDTTNTGGFRLFEIDRDGRDGPNEHDAVEGDTWTAGDLIDYLAAVGEPKDTTSWDRKNDNRPTT
ncbi:MAG TPA: hypothetical protein PKE29_02135 [Phycisphaerales bacterium]|jgi:hypothetical protein|nr:hypothetical protein [Phycisphaerales bacterium]